MNILFEPSLRLFADGASGGSANGSSGGSANGAQGSESAGEAESTPGDNGDGKAASKADKSPSEEKTAKKKSEAAEAYKTDTSESAGGEAEPGEEKGVRAEAANESAADEAAADEAAADEVAPDKAQENGESASDGGQEDGNETEKLLGSVRETLREQIKAAETEEVLAAWRREEAAAREIYPSFSMSSELLNEPLFGVLLKNGVGVRQAYECVHLKEIIGSAVRYAVAETGRRAAGAKNGSSTRPGENSVLDRASSVTRTDVKNLTEKDIMRILSDVSKGAKISFK